MPTPIPGHQPQRTSMVLVEGAVLIAATAVGMDAIEGVIALSATTPARPRAIPVLRDGIGFLLPKRNFRGLRGTSGDLNCSPMLRLSFSSPFGFRGSGPTREPRPLLSLSKTQ